MTDLAVYTSDAPVFKIDGSTEGSLARDLRRVDVEEGALGLRSMVAHFHADGPDGDGSAEQLSYLDGQLVDLGTSIALSIGPPGDDRTLFRGTVSALEVSMTEGDAPYVTIRAEDALMRLRFTERTATYVDASDDDIVTQIADAHGLGSDASTGGPTYGLVQQWEQSDLAFLRDRALRLNAELWIDSDDVVHFADREQRSGAELRLVQGNDLLSVNARADLADQRTTVSFRGWDDLAVEAIAEEASNDVVQAEVAGGRTGPVIVGDVFDSPSLSRARHDVLSTTAAQTYAEAEMRRRARSFVAIDGVTSGTPDLVPGARLDLRRVGRPFEGAGYRCCWARHSYDLSNGYRTTFRAERPGLAS